MRAALTQENTKQFGKFAIVGLTSLAVDYALLMFLVEACEADLFFSTTVSFIVSVIINYVLSMKYVSSQNQQITCAK